MSHADALKKSFAGTPGRDCQRELDLVGSSPARQYYFCGSCKRVVVLDAKGDVIATYRLGPVSQFVARIVAWLDACFPNSKD